ncbi:MAG TPA: transketolase C-terminal domain-containing protein [Acidimicrobiales bacterium]|nr:transketolase C-terminal domain-containing protein [Acidimicrobiales bacterium]
MSDTTASASPSTSASASAAAAPATEQWNITGAVNTALSAAMARDPKLLVLGEDIADPIGGVWRTFAGLSTTYGTDRVRNTPISEQAIVGAAIGAALAGYRVVADIMFFDFIAVCLDQLANHAAKLRYMSGGVSGVPITVTTTVGSGRFGAQHTQSLEAWLMHTPGVKVVYPTTPEDAAGLMTACIDDDDPCLFIQHSGTLFKKSPKAPSEGPSAGSAPAPVPLGRADVKRQGTDVSIVAYGVAVRDALRAADALAEDGIAAEVVDLRSLVPLDVDTVLASVAKTRRAVVVHAATRFCGPGAEIAAVIGAELFGDLLAPVRRLGAEYVPVPFAAELDPFPSAGSVADAVRGLVARG